MMKCKILCGMALCAAFTLPLSADSGERGNILLLWQHSGFKDQLADELTVNAPEGYAITAVSDFNQIKNTDFQAFDAVVILNKGMRGQMNGKAKKRISEFPESRVLLVTTFHNPETAKDELFEFDHVDCVTTASLTHQDDVRALAARLWQRVEEGAR